MMRLARDGRTRTASTIPPGPTPIAVTSCQAPIAEFFCAAVAGYLGQRLDRPFEFVDDVPWPERLRRFDSGGIHVCWMCGIPYVWRADRARARVELLAAPVMASARYDGRPVYFADVVVRSDSRLARFADLRGATWSYNEDTSHSGYYLTRYQLARLGWRRAFFGRVVAAGSHEASVRMLLDGSVDASAIDSTVLELLRDRDPSLPSRLRVIDSFGPSPIPPWVVSLSVPRALRAALRESLLAMHLDAKGAAILARGRTARFAAVTDRDYDPLRRMARVAARAAL